MRKFKAGQTYKTRNGSIARIYATDGIQGYEIHGAIQNEKKFWDATTWNLEGGYNGIKDSAWDLMPEIEYWYMLVAVDVIVNKEFAMVFNSEEIRKEYIANKANIKILATFEKEKP